MDKGQLKMDNVSIPKNTRFDKARDQQYSNSTIDNQQSTIQQLIVENVCLVLKNE
jgi:hypothetical protein